MGVFVKMVATKNKDWYDERESREEKKKDKKWRQVRKEKRDSKRNYHESD